MKGGAFARRTGGWSAGKLILNLRRRRKKKNKKVKRYIIKKLER